MKIKKVIYISVGCIGLVLGAIGAIIPLLPAFPFLLIAAFGFSKGSSRLDVWFKQTKLYKNNLEDYVNGKGMTLQTKYKVITLVTFLMSIGFIMMHAVPVGQMILFGVWIFHIVYFMYVVKTRKT